MRYLRSAGFALLLGGIVFLGQVIAQPREVGWWIVVPIGAAVLAFLSRLPVEATRESSRVERPSASQ